MTFLFILRIYSATLFLVLAAGYLVTSPRERMSRWFAALCLADFCYLILATSLRQSAVPIDLGLFVYPLAIGTILSTALFVIFIWLLTQDDKPIPTVLILAIALQISIELVNMPCREDGLCIAGYSLSDGPGYWLQRLADMVELGLQLIGVFLVASGIKGDLVNARRRLRLYVLLPLFTTVIFLEFSPIWMATASIQANSYFVINTIVFAIITSLFLYLSLSTHFQYFKIIAPITTTKKNSAKKGVDDKLLEDKNRFEKIFIQDKTFLDNKLTVTSLAEQMNIPQYRLRKLINEVFGYRNFNDLLNQYRVEEFCRKAQDPQNEGLPVTSLALDSGFRSLTTFNDAFKRLKGKTPKQYRELLRLK